MGRTNPENVAEDVAAVAVAETVRKTAMTPPRTKEARGTRIPRTPRAPRTINQRRGHPRMTPNPPAVTPIPMIPTDNHERNDVEDAVAGEVVLETTTRTEPVTPKVKRLQRTLPTTRSRVVIRAQNHHPSQNAPMGEVLVTSVVMPGRVMRRSRHKRPKHRRNRPTPRYRSPRNRGHCTVAACEGRRRAVEPSFGPFDFGFLQRRNA